MPATVCPPILPQTVGRPINWSEAERLSALQGYAILDTPPEQAFDDVVRLVAQLCDAPIAVVSLIAKDRQFFKAEVGLGVRQTLLDVSICAHAILQPGLFVVPDTTRDARFAGNPLLPARRICASTPAHCWKPRRDCRSGRCVWTTSRGPRG